jgi:hypothetical protein
LIHFIIKGEVEAAGGTSCGVRKKCCLLHNLGTNTRAHTRLKERILVILRFEVCKNKLRCATQSIVRAKANARGILLMDS